MRPKNSLRLLATLILIALTLSLPAGPGRGGRAEGVGPAAPARPAFVKTSAAPAAGASAPCALALDAWHAKAGMPTQRSALAVGVIHGKLYALGGNTNVFLNTLESYDPLNDSWTPRAPMPTARNQFGVGVVGGKLYALGGTNTSNGVPALNKNEAYDPATDTWATKAPMPTPRGAFGVGVLGGKIYAVGGTNASGVALTTVQAYDPVTNTWQTRAPLPSPRHALAVGVADGRLYAVGGTNPALGTYLANVDVYNPLTNTWSSAAPLPSPRLYHDVAELDGKLYAVGGSHNGGFNTAAVEVYDPATNAWTPRTPLPVARAFLALGPLNGTLYALGGGDSTGALSKVEAYYPTCPDDCDAADALADTGARIAVGGSPQRAVVTPNGAEVYVTNYDTNNVSVISTASGLVTHTVPVVSNPDALAVTPDGAKVYVAGYNGGASVINTTTKAAASINTLGGPVRDLAITPDGTKVYLAMEGAGLKRIDTATNSVSLVSGFACPEGVGVTPDGQTLYVNYQCGGPGGSGGHDAVGRFNASTGAFLGSITGLPNVGYRLTISPDGTQVWENGGDACSSSFYNHVGCPFVPSGVVNVIKTSNNALHHSIGFAGFTAGLVSFLPDSSHALVGNGVSLSLFDASNFTLVKTIPVPAYGSVAFGPGGKAYAPLAAQNTVAVLSLSCPGDGDDDNQSPVADAGPDQTFECAGGTTQVTLDGSASVDPDGDTPLQYVWTEGADVLGTGEVLSVNLGEGPHTITLTVEDPDGASSTDTVFINIEDATPPVVSAPPDVNAPADANSCSATLDPGAATASDNCAVDLITGTRSDNQPLSAPYPVGTTTINWTAKDARGNTDSATQTVNVNDAEAPSVTPPANVNASADADSCVAVLDVGSATALDNCGVATIIGVRSDSQPLASPYPVGTTTINWTATDSSGNTSSATQTVNVSDSQPPSVSGPSASPSTLWPPNHSMQQVAVVYDASDACGGVTCVVNSVASNEPENGTGDGDASPDWLILDAHHVQLRAERAGGGAGRVYTIAVTCTDSAGNATTKTVNVYVPKSRGK